MQFALTILGSSSALPTSTRYPSAHLLNVNERFFLIDCGEGTQMQLRKYKFRFSRINHIFISHLHGDHYFGIFGLLSSFSLLGRTNPLYIYAHSEMENILNFHFKHFPLGFKVIFHPLNENKAELIFEDKQLTVTSFPLKHRIPSNGFLFKEKQKERNIKKDLIEYYKLSIKDILRIKRGEDFISDEGTLIPNKHLTNPAPVPRSYAYCSDTSFFPQIAINIGSCDLLYHESTFAENFKHNAKETGHSTAKQAAEIAKVSNSKKLILGHFSSRYKDLSIFEAEAREIFQDSYLAVEGQVYEVEMLNEKR
jgi:ribonuclease Z